MTDKPEPQDVRDMPSSGNIRKAAQILGVEPSAVRAALAQSAAQPVAWRYLPPADESWRATTDPEKARLGREEYGWPVEPLYTARDASGLIAAAEWCEMQLRDFHQNPPIDEHDEGERYAYDKAAKHFRSRAADRSAHGEVIPDCPTEGVAARQGNGG